MVTLTATQSAPLRVLERPTALLTGSWRSERVTVAGYTPTSTSTFMKLRYGAFVSLIASIAIAGLFRKRFPAVQVSLESSNGCFADCAL